VGGCHAAPLAEVTPKAESANGVSSAAIDRPLDVSTVITAAA